MYAIVLILLILFLFVCRIVRLVYRRGEFIGQRHPEQRLRIAAQVHSRLLYRFLTPPVDQTIYAEELRQHLEEPNGLPPKMKRMPLTMSCTTSALLHLRRLNNQAVN